MVINWVNLGTPFPLGIDFTGGSLLEVQFTGTRPTAAQVQSDIPKVRTEYRPGDPIARRRLVRHSLEEQSMMPPKARSWLSSKSLSGSAVNTLAFSSVSASIGAEVTRAAGIAILMAAVAILLYIWYAFRGVDHAFRYGTAAIMAMLHDVSGGAGRGSHPGLLPGLGS